jgi:hypothetical protein
VVDRRKCLLALNRTGVVSGHGSWLVLEHPALASMLTDAFDVAWEVAEPAHHENETSRHIPRKRA